MHRIETLDQLADLSDDDLWRAAADRRNMAEIRYAAMEQWLFPDSDEVTSDDRIRVLRHRATRLDEDELDEFEAEDMDREGIYLDDEGRMIVEYNGEQYQIEPTSEPGSL